MNDSNLVIFNESKTSSTAQKKCYTLILCKMFLFLFFFRTKFEMAYAQNGLNGKIGYRNE